MNKKIGIKGLIMAMSILALTGCQKAPESLILTGSVEGVTVDVIARTSGEIKEIYGTEGQLVKEGDPLARIDDREWQLKKENLELVRQIAELKYEDLKNGNSKASIRQAIANRDQFKVQLSGSQKELDYLKKQLSDAQSLNQTGASSESQVEEILRAIDKERTKYDTLADQLKSAQEGLNLVLEGAVTEQLKQALIDTQIKTNEIEQMDLMIEKTKLDSPRAGVIQNVNFEVGEYISAGQKMFSLVNPDQLTLKVYINEKNLSLIKKGMQVSISGDYEAQKAVTGEIVYIASEAEFTPKNIESKESKQEMVYEVHIDIDDPDGIIKPGMYLDADFGVLRNE